MYEQLARFYDRLMLDVDYGVWADNLIKIIKRQSPSAHEGLDLACGSGNFTVRLARAGYKMLGADPSEEMLTVAAKKSDGAGITYLCRSAQDILLAHPVDFVTMMCDGVNYCVDGLDFGRIAGLLKPNGVFVFDISGRKHLAETLGNNLFYEDSDDLTYFWQNEFDTNRDLLTLQLTFFELCENGLYRRFDEEQFMRAYRISDLINAAKPYFNVEVLDGELKSPGNDDCRRIHFICKKL